MFIRSKFKPFAAIACLFLVMLLFICLPETEADAATYSGNCGTNGANVTWNLDTDTGVLNITGSGAMKNYSSSSPWYSHRSYIKKVNIGNSVTSIGNYAFYYCNSLSSVVISDSVTSIGDYAFYDCDNLSSVVISDSVTSIGNDAFYDCDNLSSIVIGNSVSSIGSRAFYYCSNLTTVINCSKLNITILYLIFVRVVYRIVYILYRIIYFCTLKSGLINFNAKLLQSGKHIALVGLVCDQYVHFLCVGNSCKDLASDL